MELYLRDFPAILIAAPSWEPFGLLGQNTFLRGEDSCFGFMINKYVLGTTKSGDKKKFRVAFPQNDPMADRLMDTDAKPNHIDKRFISRTKLLVDDNTKEEIGFAVKGFIVKARNSCRIK